MGMSFPGEGDAPVFAQTSAEKLENLNRAAGKREHVSHVVFHP